MLHKWVSSKHVLHVEPIVHILLFLSPLPSYFSLASAFMPSIHTYLCIYIKYSEPQEIHIIFKDIWKLLLEEVGGANPCQSPAKSLTQTLCLCCTLALTGRLFLSSLVPRSPSATNTGMFHLLWTFYLQVLTVPDFRFHVHTQDFLFKMLFHVILFHYFILFALYIGCTSLSHRWHKNLKVLFLSFSFSDKHFVHHV